MLGLTLFPPGEKIGENQQRVFDMKNIFLRSPRFVALMVFASIVPWSAFGAIDILPQNISLSASTVAAGGTLTVTFDIKNQGTTSAAATTTRLRLNQSSTTTSTSDTSLGDVSTPSIAGGGVASGLNKLVTIPSGTPAGTYYIWVVADNGGVLTQSNYANDYAHSLGFTVTVTAALPDILPQNISLSSSTVTAGGTLTVTFDIHNQGTGNAAATTTRLRLNQSSTTTSAGDTSLGDVSTPSISAGGTASSLNKLVTIPPGTPAGTYYIWVVADNGSVLTQSSYANDYAHSLSFTVTAALPDILPQNISLSSSTVAAGGTLTVTFDMNNQGGGSAAATTTRLRLNQSTSTTSAGDTSLGDVSTPAISANSVASGLNKLVTIPAGTAAGIYYIWVVADNGSVLELV